MAPDLASLQRISGDSAIDQWLQVPGSWVEEPNERRGGASGVQRVYTGDGRLLYRKQQTGHVYRDWQRPSAIPPPCASAMRYGPSSRSVYACRAWSIPAAARSTGNGRRCW